MKKLAVLLATLGILIVAPVAMAQNFAPACVYDPKLVKFVCDSPSQRSAHSGAQSGSDGAGASGDSGSAGDGAGAGAGSGDGDGAGNGDGGAK